MFTTQFAQASHAVVRSAQEKIALFSRATYSFGRSRALIFGATAFTYLLALWVVTCNPWFISLVFQQPLNLETLPHNAQKVVSYLLVVLGHSPVECLIHLTIAALSFQLIRLMLERPEDVEADLGRSRPLVFWRVVIRWFISWQPFLRGEGLTGRDGEPLTTYEAVTVRYFFVRLLFLPMMVSIFYGNAQRLIRLFQLPMPQQYTAAHGAGLSLLFSDLVHGAVPYAIIAHGYYLLFFSVMVIDVAWFAFCISMETRKFSPIRMVDPNVSGWLACLACYAPLNSIVGVIFQWQVPEFPGDSSMSPQSALTYATIGGILYIIYVIADLSFGLKAGNLTYRGLVDKGPYRVIRHPMYATKTIAWFIFCIPAFNFHPDILTLSLAGTKVQIPDISANWTILWGAIAWISVYAMRALTEERYLCEFPEYREYIKRVRYRFIPWVA